MAMTPKEIKEWLENYVTEMETRLERLEESIKPKGVICGQNWIIRIGKVCITPEFDENNMTTGNVFNKDPDMCMRFTEECAKDLAPTATNGAGDKGEAVLWSDAVKDEIRDLKKVIETFKENMK